MLRKERMPQKMTVPLVSFAALHLAVSDLAESPAFATRFLDNAAEEGRQGDPLRDSRNGASNEKRGSKCNPASFWPHVVCSSSD